MKTSENSIQWQMERYERKGEEVPHPAKKQREGNYKEIIQENFLDKSQD